MRALALASIVLAAAGADTPDAGARAPGGLTTLASAVPAGNAQPPSGPRDMSHENRDIVLRLEYNGGLSANRPLFYSVTILADRSITFVGDDPAARSFECCSLARKSTLSRVDFDRLIDQLDRAQLSRVKPFYPMPPDVPIQTIILVDGPFDFRKTSFGAMSCDPRNRHPGAGGNGQPPENLCRLAALITKLAGG